MEAWLLIDFGSTNTKVTAVDPAAQRLLGTGVSYTTVETDVGDGLAKALERLEQAVGKLEFTRRLACSSAAGGLRMAASGLVPELTAEAARMACLGAGGKVVRSYSYQLNDEDIREIEEIRPDIFLLTGGTDGGNQECILHNAEMLRDCRADFPILIAGNRTAAAGCEELLRDRETTRCPNVMPRLGQLNIEPVQAEIRELFLRRIVQAKGLSKAAELVSGILMPTPAAMMAAMELLAKGSKGSPGLGDLLAVDLGGATTDVYSMASGAPQSDNVILKGIREPYAKRTVEGDIGMRYSASGVLQAVGIERLEELSGLPPERIGELVEELHRDPGILPDTEERDALDQALAGAAIETAVARHAGSVEPVYTPMGLSYSQSGKDLSGVERLILTGGAIIHRRNAGDLGAHALHDPCSPNVLKPKHVRVFVDQQYILAAMGLLGQSEPDMALAIMKKELKDHGTR